MMQTNRLELLQRRQPDMIGVYVVIAAERLEVAHLQNDGNSARPDLNRLD